MIKKTLSNTNNKEYFRIFIMDIEKKLINTQSLEQLVIKLLEGNSLVYAPVKKDNLVDFEQISSFKEIDQDYINTVQSAKSIVFPRVEKLFEIKGPENLVELLDKDLDSIPEIVLLGTRPCDAAGFNGLESIFGGDLIDNIFDTRLKKTCIISISCKNKDEKCFCTSVNGGPGDTTGSDILLTQFDDDNYLVEIITQKGKELQNKFSGLFEKAADVDKNKHLANVPVVFDINNVLGKIFSKFEDRIWLEQSLRCIGCGTCAYVCPTCGCFDIQDLYDGLKGMRKRSWDSCGFDLFTLHASGHNPRNIQSQRWRQRIMHKFQYMYEKDNVIGCVGCGRCSRSCSVDMNIKHHLINLEKEIIK